MLLEDRADASFARIPAVLNRIAAVQDRGGAVIWMARSSAVHNAALFPATHHFRLSDQGLATTRSAG